MLAQANLEGAETNAQKADHDQAPARGAPPVMSEVESLLLTMEVLEPGDAKLLAKILRDHPGLRDTILAKAQEVCGNATVAQALALLEPQPAAAAENASARHEATPPTPAQTGEDLTAAKHGSEKPAEEFE